MTVRAEPRRKLHTCGLWRMGDPTLSKTVWLISGTCHWLFDRYLISLDEDFGLLVSDAVPPSLRSLLRAQETRILLPRE